jgi:diadenosine tetraphosphate (Ap4A) HIT family hydrolase
MKNLIETRVELARRGENPYVITRLASGWVVIGDVQPLPGYCLLLADPVVKSINALDRAGRIEYSLDVLRVGDALLAATSASRINYETWGNAEPALHTHIVPRYRNETAENRRRPACMSYEWATARPFDPAIDGPFVARMRRLLER